MSNFAVLLFAGQSAAAHHSAGKDCTENDIITAITAAENGDNLFTFPDVACKTGVISNTDCPLKCKNNITTLQQGKAYCNEGTVEITQPQCQVDAATKQKYENGVVCMEGAFPSCEECDFDWCDGSFPDEKCKTENGDCVQKEAGLINPQGPGATAAGALAANTTPAPGPGAPGGSGGALGEQTAPPGANVQTPNNAQCENLKSENQNLKGQNVQCQGQNVQCQNENNNLKNENNNLKNDVNKIRNELNQLKAAKPKPQPSNNVKPQTCLRNPNATRWKCSGLPCKSTQECFTTKCRKIGFCFFGGCKQKCC